MPSLHFTAIPVRTKLLCLKQQKFNKLETSEDLAERISDAVCNEIGKIAKPRKVWIVRDMPKTRSGKIMRRVLSSISNAKDVGDVTTLANPDIVEEIQEMVR